MNYIIATLNSLGIHFWQTAIEMFIQSTILIVLLFAIDFFLRKRVRAVFRYFLWLLILVKLLLIINIASPIGVETWINKIRPAKAEKIFTILSQNFAHEPKFISQDSKPATETFSVIPARKSVITVQTQPLNKLPPLNWQGYVFLSWCIGVLVFVVLLIQRLLFIKGLISQTKNAGYETNNLFEECLKTMNLNNKKIKLKISSNMVSPAVCGLFRPVILLPDYLINKLNQQQLRAVLLHELSHIKRYDLPMNFLQTALQIIYFYNPFVWFANNIIRKIREQAVDEAVLVALGNKASEYSSTLIDIAEMAFFRPALGLRLIGVVESKKALSQRIKHILNRPIPKTAKLGFTGFLALIIVAALVLPMAKAENKKQHPLNPLQRGTKSKILPSLQAEINAARDGEIIIIPEGFYTENIIITKPVTLKGESTKNCVIKFLGNVPAINIKNVNNVTIENLTIKWSQKSTDKFIENGTAIAARDAANVLIKNCLLEPIDRPTKTPYGLLVQGRSDVTFLGGQTKGFAYAIMFTDGANGEVRDSFLEGAGHSVITLHANSKVAINHNILAKCGYHAVRNTGGTMEMKNNLVINNNRAGAYLGNKSAHGIIENNLFTRNNGAIWAYARSDVKIINNLFINSKNAAIGFRGSCKLKIEKNSFVDNPTALIRYEGKEKSKSSGAIIGKNHYWKNKKDNVDLKGNISEIIISGSPRFNNENQGDFSVRKESALEENGNVIAGLINPNIINSLWKVYTKKTDQKIKSINNPLNPPLLRGNSDKKELFVRLVVAPDDMTFEGINTTWEKLPALLKKIPNRENTVLELAKSENYFDENAFIDIFGKTVKSGRKFNFKYVSNIGHKMLGSKGTVQHEGELKFRQRIPVELIAGTAKKSKVLKTKWIQFHKRKGRVIAELNLDSIKTPETRWKIRVSIHDGEKYQEKDVIYNTNSRKKNLVFKFNNENLKAKNPGKFQIKIEQVKLPEEQVSILSTLTIKSVDGATTNIINILAQPKVTVLMGMKAEMVIGNENPISNKKDEFTGIKIEFLPEKKRGTIQLSGKISITDKAKTKKDSEISWNSKKGTETEFKIENIFPDKEYIIFPVPYDKTSFLEIKLIISGFENNAQEKKKYSQKEILTHDIDYFFNRLGIWDDEYQYYAAMWALSEKCKGDSKIKEEILTRAKNLFNTSNIENVRIQCMGIAATPEAKDHKEFIVNALHNDNNERIRKMAAYFLLFFEDKNLISELEKSLKKEKSEIVINSIEATIKRLLPLVERNLPLSEHKIDNIDLPFIDDPEIIGTWKSVDFVEEIEDFNPQKNNLEKDKLYLKKMIFYENDGKIKMLYEEGKRDKIWTKGVVLDDRSKTASKYIIKEIDGGKFLFFEWKSGDYTIRHRKPKYYVLKKDDKSEKTEKVYYAWKDFDNYKAANFDNYFPNDPEGGNKLDELWNSEDKDLKSDEEILTTVRTGLRQTSESKSSIICWIGNRYCWNKSPRNSDAIEIMYHAADVSNPFGTRHYAIYFGLSVIKSKTPAILRTLVDICMKVDDPNDLSRVAWGAKSQQQELLQYLEPYLQSTNNVVREKAEDLKKIFMGEIKAFEWAEQNAKKIAQKNYVDILPDIKKSLENGNSQERLEALKLIAKNRLTLIMDDSFINAFAKSAEDNNPKVRSQVAKIIGNNLISFSKTQKVDVVNLLLKLSEDSNNKVYYNSVYYGLSVMKNKEERVVRRLLEIAFDDREPNIYRRISRGLKRNKILTVKVLNDFIIGNDPERAKKSREIYKEMTGQTPPKPGRRVDNIDLPFVDDPEIIGTWKSVDFVKEIEDFNPEENNYEEGELYLKKMIFYKNGRTFRTWWTWTKGVIMHSGDKTAAKYMIKEIDGEKFMFFEWKSGDYTIRNMKPKYYVLKRLKKKEKRENEILVPGECFKDNLIIIYPTQKSNDKLNASILKYIKRMNEKIFQLPDSSIISDTTAIKNKYPDNNIICYGSYNGNLWLKNKVKNLPVKIEENKITAKKNHKGKNLILISSWKNPDNPKKTLVIYTSQKPEQMLMVHSVYHGENNYVIANAEFKILEKGDYEYKNEKYQIK